MNKRLLLLSLLLCFGFVSLSVWAQTVDTITIHSNKMKRDIKNVVILPEGYNEQSLGFPVVYMLHGYGGHYDTWIKKTKKNLPEVTSRLNLIIVCPEGENSWYWDSPVDSDSQFETYVSKELVAYIDANYNTLKSANGRAVTGFSMGGHGGLWLAINHPDVFGACGSMSGGVDIRPFPKNWQMASKLGPYKGNESVWDAHTVITQLGKIESNSLAIIIDCGKDDFFYQVNENLHRELLFRNIPHDYISRSGGHTHNYWANAADYQLLFFYKYFRGE